MKEGHRKEASLCVDSLKGIAVLGVFICHVGTERIPFSLYGRRGVELFLLLNGYLAYKSLHKDENTEMRYIFVSRYIRILPLALLTLLVSYLLNFLDVGETFGNLSWFLKNTDYEWWDIIISALPVSFIFPHAYYINSFVSTYLLCNFLVCTFPPLSKKKNIFTFFNVSMLSLIIVPPLVTKLCDSFMVDGTVYMHFFNYSLRGIAAFSCGMLIALLQSCMNGKKECIKKYTDGGTIIALAGLVYGGYRYDDLHPFFVICFGGVLVFCQMVSEWKVFVNRWFGSLGRVSYAFFYVHIPVFFVLRSFWGWKLSFFGAFIVSFVMSYILTEYLEKPGVRMVTKFLIKVRSSC